MQKMHDNTKKIEDDELLRDVVGVGEGVSAVPEKSIKYTLDFMYQTNTTVEVEEKQKEESEEAKAEERYARKLDEIRCSAQMSVSRTCLISFILVTHTCSQHYAPSL